MNRLQIRVRMAQAQAAGEMSHCVRRRVGALICTPDNVVIADGYNGAPRGGSRLCGGESECLRRTQQIESNTRTEVGCHHAEQNAVVNAGRTGRSCIGAWLFCTSAPCLACARIIHHAGIVRVFLPSKQPESDGTLYLEQYGIAVERVDA